MNPPETVSSTNGAGRTALVEPSIRRGPVAPSARARRAADYRLRGLDLDAPVFTEAEKRDERPSNAGTRRRRRRRLLVQLVVLLIALGLAAGFLRIAVVQPFRVTTTAMVPTIDPDTDVLVVKPRFLTGGIDPGDVIVFEEPEGSRCGVGSGSGHLVSRVIASGGQTIWSEGGDVFVDGERLDEPGWHNAPFGAVGTTPIERTTVPDGSYFVLGDNRTDTCDSRAFGPVADSAVVGEVVATTAHDGHMSVHLV